MKVTNPQVKMLMLDTLVYTDEVMKKGEQEIRVPRDTVYKGVYAGYHAARELLIKNMVVAVMTEGEAPEQKKIKLSEYNPSMGKKIGEGFDDDEIEVTESMVAAVKHYAKMREEFPHVTPESWMQFEGFALK